MDTRITQAIKRFEVSLEKLGIRAQRIVVFGSHAAGGADEHSDIDLAVVSDDFERMDIFQRLETIGLALARAKVLEPIEALGYTQEEFDAQDRGTFVADAVKAKGIRIL